MLGSRIGSYSRLRTSVLSVVVLAFALSASHCEAALVLDVDISGWEADNFNGGSGNTSMMFNLAANAQILSIDYTVSFESFGLSNRSEFVLSTERSDSTLFWDNRPAAGEDSPGAFTGSGSFTTTDPSPFDPGGPFVLGADGMLRVQVYETFPDADATPDARVSSGSLRITYAVPEPGCLTLCTLMCAVVAYRRRSS